MSLVSIILPYYKKIKFFAATYRSIIRQSYQNFELIIIYDDKDLTELKTIKKIVRKNPKVKILRNKRNLGAGLSRNYGIKKSKGKFISFIDADDIWTRNKIKDQVKFIEKNKFDFISCNYKKKFSNKIINVKPQYEIRYKDLLNSCSIGLSTVMLRKKIIKHKLFSKLKTQEDFSAWLKIMREKKISCYNLNKTLVTWNYDKKSLSSNFFQKFQDAYKVFRINENFSLINSVIHLLVLSINSLKRKIKFI